MLQNKTLCNIQTIDELCNILDISKNQLFYIVYKKKNKYRTFNIPKKNGKMRTIFAPDYDLRNFQKKIKNILEDSYNFPDYIHGFVKGKSNSTNADVHVHKRFVLNIDIEDFFPTIHFGRVCGLFQNRPFYCSKVVSYYLAKLICCDGFLPQGSPCSPVISNIICFTMDKEIFRLCKRNRCVYTRYADDITISSNREIFPKEIAFKRDNEVAISDELIKIISGGFKNGFKVNTYKLNFSKRMQRHEVTGIIVNEKKNLKKKFVKKVRAILYEINKNGFLSAYNKTFNSVCKDEQYAFKKLKRYLSGKLNYYRMVRGNNNLMFLKYASEFNKTFDCEQFNVDDIKNLMEYNVERCMIISDENISNQGSAFKLDNDKVYTSTHVLINSTVLPEFIDNEKTEEYFKQFPLSLPNKNSLFLNIFDKEKNFKDNVRYTIKESDVESDIVNIDNKLNIKSYKKSKNKCKIGDEVILVGYADYTSKSDIYIIKTRIISENVLFGRKMFVTNDHPRHGMSGGPVLNSKKEVVGIVYAGVDEEDYNGSMSGFIPL